MILAKKRVFYIILAVAAAGGLLWYFKIKNADKNLQYETIRVERGNLTQTVEATGKAESISDLSLHFEVPGVVEKLNVKAGSLVKAGEILANLRLSELNAAVAQAQANLNQKLAGSTQAEKDYYKAVVDQAAADLENNQVVVSAYEDAVSALQTSLIKLDDGLVQADNILGLDNFSVNDDFQTFLSASDPNKLNIANNQYGIVKQLIFQIKEKVGLLSRNSQEAEIDAVLSMAINAYTQLTQLLMTIGEALNASVTGSSFTQTSLSAKKTTIDTTRTSVNTQYTNLVDAKQAIVDAKVSLKIKEALYNQALANYQNKINPIREVDLAAYRAALEQAVANRNKAIIRASIDGVVTAINKKPGEFVASTEEMIRMFTPHYEIKVDIPETDIAKLKIGNTTTITLDAFGDDVKFSGQVINMELGSTDIQDVVYYKVTVALNDGDRPVQPGMTANVKISTDSRTSVLAVPLRAVRTNGFRYVKILKDGQVRETRVVLGMRADDGRVEILDGLNEGDEVVLSIK